MVYRRIVGSSSPWWPCRNAFGFGVVGSFGPVKVAPVAGARRAAPLLLGQRRTRLTAASGVVHHGAHSRRFAYVALFGTVRPLGPLAHLTVPRRTCHKTQSINSFVTHKSILSFN